MIYLDNAATTPMDPQVAECMNAAMHEIFANPSSAHAFGRKSKEAVEKARRTIATHLNCSPQRIIFTSGGTEADNLALESAVGAMGVEHIVTSPLEHHAIGYKIDALERDFSIDQSFMKHDSKGNLDVSSLEEILKNTKKKTLVAIMYANNEIANLAPAKEIAELCRAHDAYFLSDTVQTVGHFPLDLQEIPFDFITCSAHKFHGPKGIGFLYASDRTAIKPQLLGGSQEKGMRAGTENIYGILGLENALNTALNEQAEHQESIEGIKAYMIQELNALDLDIQYNGMSDQIGNSLYTVLSVSLPPIDHPELALFKLDLAGICCSGGSACQSGGRKNSHVLSAMGVSADRPGIRFSFSKYTTKKEIDAAVSAVKSLILS